MSESNESFEKDLDQLIKLFKRIREKSENEHLSQLDPAFLQNLDFIINNYEMIKHNIPKEMFGQMGFPFQKVLREFIQQLKEEMGDDIYEEGNKDLAADIHKIDNMLQNPGNLSEEEINDLLDKRSEIIKNSSDMASPDH